MLSKVRLTGALAPASYPSMNTPSMPGKPFVFLILNSPRYQYPPRSFLILTSDLTFCSGEPGPIEPATNVVSHFQLPSQPLYRASISGDGFGISIGAAAAGAAAFSAA